MNHDNDLQIDSAWLLLSNFELSSVIALTSSCVRTMNDPPPEASVMIAMNLGFTAQKPPSHPFLLTRMLS